MYASVCHEFGSPDALVVETVPDPTPERNEVVVRIEAAGVNYADALMVAGQYQVIPRLPFIPGLEFAGSVAAVGPDVDEWQVGDRVMGAPAEGGCFAEYIRMPASRLFAVPPEMSFDLAAGFLVSHGTAGFALDYRGGLQPGESALITGAGGGVGVAAVGVAKRLGAFVVAAAGSDEKLQVARAHGADTLINYVDGDLRESVMAATQGRGADVLLEVVGGGLFTEALRSLAPWGRAVVVGFAGGEFPRIPAEYLMLKNLSVLGAGFGRVMAEQLPLARQTVERVTALHQNSPFPTEIADRLRLDQVPTALARLTARQVTGKFVVVPGGATAA